MRTPTIDIDIPCNHHVENADQIEFHTYDDAIEPCQRSVFLSLQEGQIVKVKDRVGTFVVKEISASPAEGEDDVWEIKLILKHQ